MNPKLTELVVIIDKSGSMCGLKNDTIGGFNELLEKQRKLDGDVNVTLCLFDNQHKLVHDGVNICSVKSLDGKTYETGGTTALLDAVGFTIDSVGSRLAKTEEDKRPSKVIVAIITDGEENASKEFKKADILEKINHQTDKYSWQFLFLGANQDSFAEAGGIGVRGALTTNYVNNSVGLRAAFGAVNVYTSDVRSGCCTFDSLSAYYNASLNTTKNP